MLKFNAKHIKKQIVEWIQQYFEENGRDCKAVIGISGGKDSSIVAALLVEALGKERVHGVLIPQGEQYDIDVSIELVKLLGIPHSIVNIGSTVDSLYNALKDGDLSTNQSVKINSPARIRMTILYAVSAIVDGRVANTGNLSEDYVGYSTKFGDGAGDFSPLARLTVTEIKAIGRETGLPEKFIEKIPEDGLTGKSDEDNLGFSYDILDKYLREGVCDDRDIKDKIDRLHRNNVHKMKLIPAYEIDGDVI